LANLAVALKEVVRRLARKEIREETGKTKQAVNKYRRDIATLKRQLRAQEKEIAHLKAQERKRGGEEAVAEGPQEKLRFSARSVRAQRQRLGLSAQDYGRLVGVTPLTIYNWEHGKARPRQAQFKALVDVRKLGKREAMAKLNELKAQKKKRPIAPSRKRK